MAARENQGLQIALIIFVMLTIVLIVTTYMFFRSYSDERDRAKGLAEQKATADQAANKAIADSDALKAAIGAAQTETVEAVREAAEKELLAHGAGLGDAQQNYRGLVNQLAIELAKLQADKADLVNQVKALNDKLATNDQAASAEVEKYTSELGKASSDLAGERKSFNDARTELTGQKDVLAAGFETTRREHEELLRKSTAQIAALSTDLGRANQLLDALRNKEQLEQKAYEVPDGQVAHVNQRTRLAWINVGAADGLRRQTSFVVVAPEDGNPVTARPKGTIEVTRLTDDHRAEARIVEDDLSNPIMPGDNIFSIAWQPGRAERFALAGTMDIDGDGASDRAKVRELIAINGGVIDAEVADDGTRTGQMSVNTKYLVLGGTPDAESRDREGVSTIRTEAQSLGVKMLPMNEFLDYLGYKDEGRAVTLGRQARSSDFKPRLPGDRQRTMPGSTVPKDLRRPPPSTYRGNRAN